MRHLLLTVMMGFVIMHCKAQGILPDSIRSQLKINVTGFMGRYHSPGIAVAVIHDQDIIYSEALGYVDVENKIPSTIDAKYPVLSVSKTFTATMLMQLKAKQLVQLYDDVRKYLPEFKHPATLLQLATHTSGLPRNTQADLAFMQGIDRWIMGASKDTAIVASTQQAMLQSLPFITTEYPAYDLLSYSDRHYSNLGYSMLGIALERAAKTSYTTYVKQHIMQPLGMSSSGFLQDADNPRVAAGYRYDDSTKSVTRTPVFVPNSAMPAGGVYSTARDLAKYISFQFRDDAAANEILPATDKAMMRAFNIGWKPAYPFVLHEGAMLGYRCEVFFSPALKLGWVILTNVSDFEFNRINTIFSQLLTPVFNKKAVTDLHKYTGTYKLAGGAGSLDISIRNGQLYSTYLAEQLGNVPLTLTGDNHFQVKVPGTSFSLGYDFITNAASQKMILNLDQFMWVKE